MKTEVAIIHHQYPAKIREHVANKLQNLVKYFEGTVSVRAVLERDHDIHRAELVANVRRGVVLVVDAKRESISMAIDEAVDRMARVLTKHKDKLRNGTRRKSRTRSS